MSNLISPTDELSADQIMDYIVHLIKNADKLKDFSGKDKSDIVLKQVKSIVGTETYERYESMFSASINLICKLGKNKTLLKGINGGVKCCLPIFKKCL